MVTEGFAFGFEIFVADNPAGGVQAYETPLTEAIPICCPDALVLHVLVNGVPALASGTSISTVTVTSSVAVHPLVGFVAVKVYVVVTIGLAGVDAAVELVSPLVGVQA